MKADIDGIIKKVSQYWFYGFFLLYNNGIDSKRKQQKNEKAETEKWTKSTGVLLTNMATKEVSIHLHNICH